MRKTDENSFQCENRKTSSLDGFSYTKERHMDCSQAKRQ